MDMYGKVLVVLNPRGWKLEAKITPKVKVDVTKFSTGNGEKYIHINRNGNALSLHYEEYEELCLIKEAIDKQLHHLDEPVPDLTVCDLSTTADSTTPPMMPAQLPVPSPSYTPLPVEGIQYGAALPPYYSRFERCPTPTTSSYSPSPRHHPYNKQ